MMVENVGNVCDSCFKEFKGSVKVDIFNSLPNTELNIMLKGLKFPCKFESAGCNALIMYENLQTHQKECVFRTVRCVLPKIDCEWKGRLTDLTRHFKEEHPKHVVNGPFDVFTFEVNIPRFTDLFKLLSNVNKTYILKINKSSENEYLLQFIEDVNCITQDREMVVKYIGKHGQYKVKVKRLPMNSDETTGTRIGLQTLHEISDENGNITVSVKPIKCELENINEQVLRSLECPVCKELMRPPIVQCSTGHSCCKPCRVKLNDCPTCRNAWAGDVRNFSLEALTPSVQYSCMYSQFGCDARFLGDEINKHEGICGFKMYSCPNCNFTGNYLSTKNHFKLNHRDNLIESTIYKHSFVQLNARSQPTEDVKYFFAHNNIYKLTFKRLQDSCSWNIRILNNYDQNIKYFYVISIKDPNVEQLQITKSNLCLSANGTPTNNGDVAFTYTYLASYRNSNNEQIACTCQIYEN